MVPSSQYSIAMASGGIVAFVWAKKFSSSYELGAFSIPAGMIAGEGIGGLITALLEITNVGGSKYGTGVGCILNAYCG